MENWAGYKKKKFKVKSYFLRTLKSLLYYLLALRATDEKSVASSSLVPLKWLVWSLWDILGSTDYSQSRILQKSV